MSHDANNLRRDATELARNTSGGWVRTAGNNNAAPNPPQLALVLYSPVFGPVASPHYDAPYDTSFVAPQHVGDSILTVAVVLLKNGEAGDGGAFVVDKQDGDTLESLTIVAIDMRREGKARQGDLVYIWSSDGEPIEAGENGWVDGQFVGNHGIYTAPISATDYLRGLDTWNDTDPLMFVSDPSDHTLKWVIPADYPGGPIGGGGGGGITGVAEGYAIDVTGTGSVTVHNDPTEWTHFDQTKYQIMRHDVIAGTPARTDPDWVTVSGYDGTVNQIWFVKAGVVTAKTTATYDATKNQQLINKADDWEWDDAWTIKSTINDSTPNFHHDACHDPVAASTYSSAQDLLVNNETVGASATNQTERFFVDSSSISGWNGSVVQGLTHDASGNLKWDAAGSGGGISIGHVTTQGTAATTWDTPTTDGRCTLSTSDGGTTGIIMANYDPDGPIPVGAVVKLDGTTGSTRRVITWSCGTL